MSSTTPNSVPVTKMSIRQWATRLRLTREERVAYALLSPLVVLLTVFLFYPALSSVALAFQQWSLGGVEPNRWIGLGNYRRMVDEWRFLNSLRVTIVYAIGMVFLPFAVALPLALLMNTKVRGRTFFRMVFFLPVVTPITASALVFVYMLNTDYGIINSLLLQLGLIARSVPWLGRPATAIGSTLGLIVWGTTGFNAVTLLAGLQTITSDIYEAARMDGASGWTMLRHITLPLLRPATITVMTVNLVGAFKMFGEVYLTTQGGPGSATEVMGLYLYMNAFAYWQLGYATAIGTVIFAICLAGNAWMARLGQVDWQ